MPTSFRVPRAALLFSALALACSDDPVIPAGSEAELTVIHASPATGPIDVRVADVSAVSGLAYGRSSGVRRVPAGAREIIVRSGSAEIARFTANLAVDQGTSLTIGEDTTQVGTVIPDTGIVASNRANLRVVNVVGTNASPPTLLALRINFPGVSVDSTAVLGLDTRVASHGPLMYFDAGHFRVALAEPGSTTALASVEFDVAAGEKVLIVVERSASGAYSVRTAKEP